MPDNIPVPTDKQVKRAARNHANAMLSLHQSINHVAITAARLVEILERANDAPFAGGTLYKRVDDAMGELGRVYGSIAKAFDDLE